MTSLFIIGNGLDISHKIPTSYQSFREYLQEEYPDASPDDALLTPWSSTMPDGDEQYDSDEVVSTIMRLIDDVEGEKWSNLEHSLGYLDYDDYFEEITSEDDNEWHTAYNNEDNANNLAGAVLMITDLFADWIKTININSAKLKNDFKALINTHQDFFLSFNYTLTLEQLYDVTNICHIHGMQGEKLYFGHGNTEDYYDEYISKYTGSESSMSNLQNSLRKDTQQALQENSHFFSNLSSVDKIYSYGFSFADVDLIYIKEICKKIDTKRVIWLLNDFDSEEIRTTYIEKIRRCGFQGDFDTYYIS